MNKDDLDILINAMPGNERPPEFALKLLEDTCARTGLDWKMRHVYLMKRGGKWTVTLSIDGFRLIAAQDPDYAGQEGPFWVTAADGAWSDIPPDGAIYAAKVGVKHKSGNTTWGVAKYKDYAAGPMWTKFPSTMSAKCAEMLALRKAMPGRLGGLYGVEEMQQAGFKSVEDKPEEPKSHGLFGEYLARMKAVNSLAELKAIGKEASSSHLEESELMKIHAAYTERKAALGG